MATGNPTFVVIGDFNNDGKPDLAVANGAASTATVSIMFGNGDGTFQPAIDTATNGATSLVAADFNGDGKLDLAVTGTAAGVKVLLGKGDGTFTTGYVSFSSAAGVLAADINGDGKLDIIFYGGAYLGIKLGNGDGTFRDDLQVNLQQVTARIAVVGDFNGDGRLDLVIITPPMGGRGGGSSTFMMFGMPDGSLGQPFLTNMIPGSGNTVTADFNGDGKLDTGGAGVPSSSSGASLGNGDGQFHFGANGFGERLLINCINCFAAVGDFDRNGAPDTVVANGQTVDVALNTGGHPPLLSSLFLFQPSATGALTIAQTVAGGRTLIGNAYLGGPAPVGGTVITLSSSDLSAFFPGGNTVTIPAGAQVAAFGISTTTVGVPTPVTITVSSGVATANSTFTLIPPFVFTSFSVDQTSLFGLLGFGVLGGNPVVGTVTFNNPAALKVPASVPVPRGATTETLTLGAWPVATDAPVIVSTSFQGLPSMQL